MNLLQKYVLKKRRRISKLKAFIDFLSDEDKQDFSSGSSDLWSFNESSMSSDGDQNIINKKNKDIGKSYKNRKGETVHDRVMKTNPCVKGKCARGCYDIPEERRTVIFEYFWNLDAQRRRHWIVHCTHSPPIKRKKTNSALSRRNITYQYFINDGEGHKQKTQCFRQIYGRSKNLRAYIENLPAVPSHYNRKKSNKVYLPQEMKNVTNLFQMYSKSCLEQNEQALTENNKNEMSNEEKDLLNAHNKEKKATYKRFKRHQTINSPGNDTITCSFDLQEVLNTPHGQSMLLYYSRKYSVFNFTIYESCTQEVYCFTWGECDGKRGSNEIATCLVKYLEEKDKQGIKHLLMNCDSCSGQNKNKNVLAAGNYFLNPSQWSTYFESARKNPRPYKVNVLDYSDFQNFDQVAANAFTPTTSKSIKFKDIRVATLKKKYEDQVFVKYTMEENAQTHTITLKEKQSVKGKRKKLIKTKAMSQNQSLVGDDVIPLYNCRIPIAAAKYKDLINLCENGTISKRFHGEYRELPKNSQTQETLNETDEDDEPYCNEKDD
ncbi:hypothetical protein ABMA27_010454 [Loxostege sticticalis]|uniref:Uncharacterized protein n=1 Tax=Loxostege sticticalis TaxID=481309 RepID=A0ABR3H5Q8_LOXSC